MLGKWLARHRNLAALGLVAGSVLLVIGFRFLLVPEAAQRTFGLPRAYVGSALHAIVGIRDVWLALLAITFAGLRQWRALGLWALLGVGVCLADGLLVVVAGGPWVAVVFHWGSGVFLLVLGVASWRAGRA